MTGCYNFIIQLQWLANIACHPFLVVFDQFWIKIPKIALRFHWTHVGQVTTNKLQISISAEEKWFYFCRSWPELHCAPCTLWACGSPERLVISDLWWNKSICLMTIMTWTINEICNVNIMYQTINLFMHESLIVKPWCQS